MPGFEESPGSGTFVTISKFTAKGDLLVGTGAGTFVKVAVGTDGQALTADSTSAGGVKWATISGGVSYPLTLAQTAGGAAVTLSSIVPSVSTAGPFRMGMGSTLFNSTYDFVSDIGINPRRSNTTNIAFYYSFEDNYETSPGTYWMEHYQEWVSADGLTSFRPYQITIDRANSNIRLHTLMFGTTGFQFIHQASGNTAVDIEQNAMQLGASANAAYAFNIQSPATVALSMFGGGVGFGGTAWLSLQAGSANGATLQVGGRTILTIYSFANQQSLTVGSSGGSGVLVADMAGTSQGATPGIVVRQRATPLVGQDLFHCESQAAAVVGFRLNYQGAMMISANAAPSGTAGVADVAAGEMSIWFDKTDGAGKLMVRAKTANGTAVTGSLVLA